MKKVHWGKDYTPNRRVSQFSFAEEPFTDLIYNSFVQINKWKYDVDFNIQTEI